MLSTGVPPMLFEEFVEAAGRGGFLRAEFLREKRDFKFFDEPAEFAEEREFGWVGWFRARPFLPGVDVGLDLFLAFLIFRWIERGTFGADGHCFEVAWQFGDLIPGCEIEKALGHERGEILLHSCVWLFV